MKHTALYSPGSVERIHCVAYVSGHFRKMHEPGNLGLIFDGLRHNRTVQTFLKGLEYVLRSLSPIRTPPLEDVSTVVSAINPSSHWQPMIDQRVQYISSVVIRQFANQPLYHTSISTLINLSLTVKIDQRLTI